jgi:hypothetical protein
LHRRVFSRRTVDESVEVVGGARELLSGAVLMVIFSLMLQAMSFMFS